VPLITPAEAAKLSHVTTPMIGYWIRNGWLKKHPTASGHKRNYLVELDEVRQVAGCTKFELILRGYPDNIILPKEASALLGVGTRMITYYSEMGYITKHYIFGNTKHYAVDKNEIEALASAIDDRIHHVGRIEELREYSKKLKRDSRGWWIRNDD
jgi:DNA-binding transcriptional MerR regulator